jgi:hypothetical protein
MEKGKLTFSFSELNGDERLRELILYISAKCADDPTYGATKLNKILFYSDFISYIRSGKPVAGLEYQKLPNGPAPKRLVPIRDRMETAKELAIQKTTIYNNRTQHRCVPLRDPDLNAFSGPEIALIDEVIQILWGATAKSVSELSHQRPWRIAKERESIPYQSVFLSDENFDDSDVHRLRALNAEHNLD